MTFLFIKDYFLIFYLDIKVRILQRVKVTFLFLAKLNGNYILASENSFKDLDVDIYSFNWDADSSNKLEKEKKNLMDTLNEPPIENTAKIICVGRNYAGHAEELGNKIPKEPLLFQKPLSSVIGNNGTVILPEKSKQVEYETELVVIIKKRGKNIRKDEAMDYILGYTIGLDITARDLQKRDKTWFRGKSYDTFAPIGPWIANSSSVDLSDCNLSLYINNEKRQMGNTKNMIFDISSIIEYISSIVSLNPGDIIFTGTPEGVGIITPGDKLKASIDGIGTLNISVQ
ncbi:MAG: Ureidoglycolate lyase [Candidatus Heimdallarchaeota archaeon LC_3]|nr:MAG: Ureidoglycolate lyase [Candidatus Heimdallarchaeota archaeon LC_3]